MKKINQFIKDNYPVLIIIVLIIFIILSILNLFILKDIAHEVKWIDVNVYNN